MYTDPFLWLEDISSQKAMNFVHEQNRRVEALLTQEPDFQKTVDSLKAILGAPDRIPSIRLVHSVIYNFWQDEAHTRGLLRRASKSEFNNTLGQPVWETVLDLDQLATQEGRNWVWEDADYNDYGRCLIFLSDGGTDASVVREFDLASKEFVADGFFIPEGKSNTCWLDADTLLVGLTGDDEEETSSGYPKRIRRWKRGTPLADAPVIFSGLETDVMVGCERFDGPEGIWVFVVRTVEFFQLEYHLISPDGPLRALNIPNEAKIKAVFHHQLIVSLDKPSTYGGIEYPPGSVLAFPLNDVTTPSVVFTPNGRTFLNSLSRVRSGLVIELLEDVTTRLRLYSPSGTDWTATDLVSPDFSSGHVAASESFSDEFYYSSESFIVPRSLHHLRPSPTSSNQPRYESKLIKALDHKFDSTGLVASQHFIASADGTRVPYFLVHARGLQLTGENPTLLYGYGGFQASFLPYYDGLAGKAWLEKGGVFVLANIRGGGEFGPAWHAAALKENRQRSFDDFIAVAEDLISRKITSPHRLAIQGGSNGGLLVGAVMVQRPELFKAVICDVPLLDMFRYHLLLAGASWQAEYGNVEDVDAAAHAIREYSPYQNVKSDVRMPTVLFTTSTKDDRVHPAHARKMTARMQQQGHEVFLYENIEGGHAGAANIHQTAFMDALRYSFLSKTLKNI